MNILFLCTGNSCRSPLAEYYFQQLCRQNKLNEVISSSAGTKAEEGREAPELSVELFKLLDLDISAHRSQPLCADIIEETDAIIAMGKDHVEFIKENYPEMADKTQTLLSFVDSDDDVTDPHNGTLDDYEKTFLTMMPALSAVADRLLRCKEQEALKLLQEMEVFETEEAETEED